jgi:Tol biopolymer transport system component
LLLALPALAAVVKIYRVSPPPLDLEVTLESGFPSISADGRFVAFVSYGSSLGRRAAGTICVQDRQTGTTEFVESAYPATTFGWVSPLAISGDGRFVAFVSDDNEQVPGDTNGWYDILVRDRQTGATEIVSVTASGTPTNMHSSFPAISADGRFVAFASEASNLVPGDMNGKWDVFVRDRQAATTELVSVAADGGPADGDSSGTFGITSVAISADGRFIAFLSSASNLAPGTPHGGIFVRDRETGRTEVVSVSNSGAPASGDSISPSVSGDGRFIAFASDDSNLAPEDTNDGYCIFVRDRQTGTTEWVADGNSPSISADGRFVAFVSGDEIWLVDRQRGTTELVSISARGERSASSWWGPPSISGDGRFVAFLSNADNRAVVRDRTAATTVVVAVSVNVGRTALDSRWPAISSDGQWVAFETAGQVFVRNRITGTTELVSATDTGTPSNGRSLGAPAISADGRFVAFASDASNLGSADRTGILNVLVFVRDRQLGKTECVSVTPSGAPAGGWPDAVGISGDGRFVVFSSHSGNLVAGDTNLAGDVFVRDRETGKTELVSVAADGGPANGYSCCPSISADGRLVVFDSMATNVAPGHDGGIFVRDRQSGRTEWVGDGDAPSISADGRFVAFASSASDLVPGDTNSAVDSFLRDRQTGKTELVSVSSSGSPANGDSSDYFAPAISGDGRFIAFQSRADNLSPGDTNDSTDVFLRDRQTGRTEQVSVTTSGTSAGGASPAISGDGRFVAFESYAGDLVPGDTNGRMDVFVAERG